MSDVAFRVASADACRISEEMTLHTLAGMAGHWAAFRLSDGTPKDHVAYASWADAVKYAGKHDRDETIYLLVQPDGMQPKEAESFLRYARFLHDAGHRLPPPDSVAFDYCSQLGSGLPALKSDRYKMARHLISGGREFPGGS
jgi:hypothetical protein